MTRKLTSINHKVRRNKMTVQELIDELMKVEDKSKEVVYWIYGYYHGVDKVEEDEEGTILM